MPLKAITVTQEDVDQGCPMSATECPTAIAARRVFDSLFLTVGGSALNVLHPIPDTDHDRVSEVWVLPENLREQISRYDRSGDFEPGTYHVRLYEPR